MVQQKERENIRSMLTDTVKLLVKNGLTFKHKFNIDGLLGITVDDGDVFLVPMSELVKSDNVHGISLELEVEESHTRTKSPDISSPTSTRSRPGQRVRKRQRMNTRNTGSSRDAGSSDDENGDDFSQGDVSEIPEGTPGKPDSVDASNVNDVSESLPKNISIKREIDEEAWMQEQQSYPDLSDDQSADRSSFLDPAYSATPVTGVYRHPGMDNMPGTSGTQNMDEEELAISGMPKKSNPRAPFTCVVCDKQFKHNKNLKEHNMVVHNAARPHCLVCGKPCLPSSLTRHMAKHTRINTFGCSACTSNFTTKTSAQRHVKKACFAKKAKIIALPHPPEALQKHKEETKRSLTEFHRTIKRERMPKIKKKSTGFSCPDCHKIYCLNKNLKEHRISVHSIGEKQICPVCGKSYMPSAFAVHVATHSDDRKRQYTCSTCGYAYYRKDTLRRHVQLGSCANRITSKSKIKHTCRVCGMSYKLKSSYEKHFKGVCAKRLAGGDKFFSAERLFTAETGPNEMDSQNVNDGTLVGGESQDMLLISNMYGSDDAVTDSVDNQTTTYAQDVMSSEVLAPAEILTIEDGRFVPETFSVKSESLQYCG